jgi:hypothetical protein
MSVEDIEMRISLLSIPLLLALALPANPQSYSVMPRINSVEPTSGKVGDAFTIQGENLGQENVAELYLTDGKADVKVRIIEQTSSSIKFRMPPEAKPGRFALMVLTKGADPKLIEQPAKIVVDTDTTD